MDTKRLRIPVKREDLAGRERIAQLVFQVVADYDSFVLADATEAQIHQLRDEGFRIQAHADYRTVRLRSVTFDTTEAPPPTPLRMRAMMAARPEVVEPYQLVQFVGPMQEAWREQMEELGVKLLDYVPNNAFITRMRPEVQAQVQSLPFVQWVGPYHPAYKISPRLTGRRRGVTLEEFATLELDPQVAPLRPQGNLEILLHEPEAADEVARAVEGFGGQVVARSRKMVRVNLDVSWVDEIAAISGVKWIDRYVPPKLLNNIAAGIIKVTPVRDPPLGLEGDGQIVAVCDTGLDNGANDATMHPDFRNRIVAAHALGRPGDWGDPDGHGTHVAGSVLGNGAAFGKVELSLLLSSPKRRRDNCIGTQQRLERVQGMAPKAKLVFQSVLDAGGDLGGIPADLNALFQQAYDDGARIHNNSWGSAVNGSYESTSDDVDEFVWGHKDMVILCAAGNESTDGNRDGVIDYDSLDAPASARNCIAVGASENDRDRGGYQAGYGEIWPSDYPSNPLHDDPPSDNLEGVVAFSSRGPCDDGRIKPDVVAPGTNILSTRSSATTGEGWGPYDDFYMYMGGTSMATPITSGAAALLREYLVKEPGHEPSAALVKAMLINGATPLTGQYVPSEAGIVPNKNQGWGRINLEETIIPKAPKKVEFVDEWADPARSLSTGQSQSFDYAVTDASVPLRIALVWTDYHGATLQNDLDLIVTTPSGKGYHGNLFALPPNTPTLRKGDRGAAVVDLQNELNKLGSILAIDGIFGSLTEAAVKAFQASQLLPDNGIVDSQTWNAFLEAFDRVNNVECVFIQTPEVGTYTVRVDAYRVSHGPQDFALVVSGGLA